MHQKGHDPIQRGITLVELMIAIAILSILAGIAIPLYNGYVTEGHMASMRTTLNGLRTPLEDYRLENGNYGTVTDLVGIANITGRFDWDPSGDSRAYEYTVSVTGTNSYDVWGIFQANTGIWVRCEDRFSECCDSEIAGSSTPDAACP
ncbi:MAG: prepilin-type N-terminal cleavage/methylation domain-containing protein [Gammaproteobacteria bacterium]|nr:prepilin-type N-terminal cleavage/methylation domain-containing protein [Gammaproteobacteria bacterium]